MESGTGWDKEREQGVKMLEEVGARNRQSRVNLKLSLRGSVEQASSTWGNRLNKSRARSEKTVRPKADRSAGSTKTDMPLEVYDRNLVDRHISRSSCKFSCVSIDVHVNTSFLRTRIKKLSSTFCMYRALFLKLSVHAFCSLYLSRVLCVS